MLAEQSDSAALNHATASAQASVQAGLDLRDNGGERPDDN